MRFNNLIWHCLNNTVIMTWGVSIIITLMSITELGFPNIIHNAEHNMEVPGC